MWWDKTIADDMSYNNGPMISRGLMDESMAPYYKTMLARVKEMEMLTIVDTDGDVTLLVPWLLEHGVEGVLPLERQADSSPVSITKRLPVCRWTITASTLGCCMNT